MAPLPLPHHDWALFLDFDGTLVDLEDDPTQVLVEPELRRAVAAARTFLGGALALVSGRPVSQMDKRFAPDRHAVAGIHGLERRSAQGVLRQVTTAPGLHSAAVRLQASFAHDPRIHIEDKAGALAIHYRRVREAAAAIHEVVESLARELPGYRVLQGSDVVELVPAHANKGNAVREFMAEPPFSGRVPVFVGDDITDLDGFEAARKLGGFGIAVGPRVVADHWLKDTIAVRAWLQAACL